MPSTEFSVVPTHGMALGKGVGAEADQMRHCSKQRLAMTSRLGNGDLLVVRCGILIDSENPITLTWE